MNSTPARHLTASLILSGISLAISACSAAPPVVIPLPTPVDEAPLPVDPRIAVGTLDTGLTYYVLPHQKPENRAQLWLVVNAGSVLEDDDQKGLAHFVEHMAFNGTKTYPKQELVDFIERAGMDFGADLNAYTAFDETVYMLQVPTDDEELVAKGLDILHEWAAHISFEPEEIEKERGVVLEEWRLGRGAWGRIRDKQYPVLMNGSRHAERLPIGDPATIEHASRETIERFYRDWYRPDLMAVVAVGDFDRNEMVGRIEKQFGDLQKRSSERERRMFPVPDHAETLVSADSDDELPSTSVSLITKLPHRPELTKSDYRQGIVERLFSNMMNARLYELSQKPGAPFLRAGTGFGSLTRTTDQIVRSAGASEGKVLDALALLVRETSRVEQHGFTESELDRARASYLRAIERAVIERDKTNARAFSAEIVRNFLEGESMPGIEAELEMTREFLPTIGLAELNTVARESSGTNNRVILVTGPSKTPLPDKAEILAAARSAESASLEAWNDETPDGPLVERVPVPGKVVRESGMPELGVTEWTLSNGVRVVIKPTDFQNDSVTFGAYSPGGSSTLSDQQYETAKFATTIVNESGLGSMNVVALRKALTGHVAGVRPYISLNEEGLWGGAAPEDLETLLQLVYLQFYGTRVDPDAIGAWKIRTTEALRNQLLDPNTVFNREFDKVRTGDDPRSRPPTIEQVESLDPEKARSFFVDRFSNADDFTFFFVGNVDIEALRPLVDKWLGSLPSTGRKDSVRVLRVPFPAGINHVDVPKGKEPKSKVRIAFGGDTTWSREAAIDAQLLNDVLNIRLREILREDMGGVYGVSIWGSVSREEPQSFSFEVGFGCAPDQVEPLTKAVFDVIQNVRRNGISETYLEKVRENWKRTREEQEKQNGFWIGILEYADRWHEDPAENLDLEKSLARISSENVREAAKRYLDPENFLMGVLRPEEPDGNKTQASTGEE